MNINLNKFKTDESRSNPMVVAMQYPDCSINQICFYAAVGFGTPLEQCKHFKVVSDDKAECLYNVESTNIEDIKSSEGG